MLAKCFPLRPTSDPAAYGPTVLQQLQRRLSTTIMSPFHLNVRAALVLALLGFAQALPGPMPQKQDEETPQQKANKIPQGIMKAKDGSVILDATEKVK